MTLENVKKEIIEEANRKVTKLEEQTQIQVKNLETQTKEECHNFQEKADSQTKHVMETLEAKMRSQAKFDARKKLLSTKREAVDSVLTGVKEKLLALDDGQRKKLLTKLLERAKKEIDVHTVYVNSRDLKLIPATPNIKVAKIQGGLIAETKDGSISVNLSLTEILADIKEKHLVEISEALFK